MRRLARFHLVTSLVAISLLFGLVSPSTAEAAPKTLTGSVSGIELCPQFLCGSAYFAGSFAGSVGGSPDTGFWAVSIQHDPLPGTGGTTSVSGGEWSLITLNHRTLTGRVTGGTITNNGGGLFTVSLEMKVRGYGTVEFVGTLDHTDFPPTIIGTVD